MSMKECLVVVTVIAERPRARDRRKWWVTMRATPSSFPITFPETG